MTLLTIFQFLLAYGFGLATGFGAVHVARLCADMRRRREEAARIERHLRENEEIAILRCPSCGARPLFTWMGSLGCQNPTCSHRLIFLPVGAPGKRLNRADVIRGWNALPGQRRCAQCGRKFAAVRNSIGLVEEWTLCPTCGEAF